MFDELIHWQQIHSFVIHIVPGYGFMGYLQTEQMNSFKRIERKTSYLLTPWALQYRKVWKKNALISSFFYALYQYTWIIIIKRVYQYRCSVSQSSKITSCAKRASMSILIKFYDIAKHSTLHYALRCCHKLLWNPKLIQTMCNASKAIISGVLQQVKLHFPSLSNNAQCCYQRTHSISDSVYGSALLNSCLASLCGLLVFHKPCWNLLINL